MESPFSSNNPFYVEDKLSLNSMRDFIATFKTERCLKPAGLCKFDTFLEENTKDIFAICRWNHNGADSRRCPFKNRATTEIAYANELCDEYDYSKRKCPHSNCRKCRNMFEMNYHPYNYKRYSCHFYLTKPNGCFLGRKCFNHHDKSEMEIWTQYMNSPDKAKLEPVPTSLPVDDQRILIRDDILKEARRNVEPSAAIEYFNGTIAPEVILEKVLTFLNRYGGTIYCGVKENAAIQGLTKSVEALESFRTQLEGLILRCYPPIPLHFVEIKLLRVLDGMTFAIIPNTYVIEIACIKSCFYHSLQEGAEGEEKAKAPINDIFNVIVESRKSSSNSTKVSV